MAGAHATACAAAFPRTPPRCEAPVRRPPTMLTPGLTILLLAGALAFTGCELSDEPDPLPNTATCYPLEMRTDLAWFGTNRATVTGWLDGRGCDTPSYDPGKR